MPTVVQSSYLVRLRLDERPPFRYTIWHSPNRLQLPHANFLYIRICSPVRRNRMRRKESDRERICNSSFRNSRDIAEEFKVSTNTVSRAFKLVSFTNKPKLPTTLGIDEFKGNTRGEKYNVILTNLENFKITDILPSRKKSDLISYFMRYSREERNNVKVLVMDMHSNYKEIRWLFPSVEIVVDKYHFVRQVYFALDNVRKRIQKQFSHDKILHFKHNRYALWKDFKDLKEETKILLLRMLDHNGDLYSAWTFKEWFSEIKKLKAMTKQNLLYIIGLFAPKTKIYPSLKAA